MTNKEILNADVLDILFENRNKSYGAYALRKEYNHRLGWALGSCLALCLLLLLINFFKGKTGDDEIFSNGKIVQLTDIEIPDKPKEPEQPKKTTEQIKSAEIKSTAQIRIVNEPTDVPDRDDIENAEVSTKTIDGARPDGITKPVVNTNTDNGNNNTKEQVVETPQVFTQSDAQYPGGKEAFAAFLSKYLVTPEDLEPGEKKMVLVRFIVDAEGNISKTEIVQSGGDRFDKEVLRVLRKMPKWIPALQNGFKVSTYFTQPVTFIGIEQ